MGGVRQRYITLFIVWPVENAIVLEGCLGKAVVFLVTNNVFVAN